jgi:hypothetical protein
MKNYREMMLALLAGDTLVNDDCAEWKLDENGELDTCKLPMPSTVKIKPKTININGFYVPDPLRKALNIGETYYIAEPHIEYVKDKIEWEGCSLDFKWLRLGICHKTKEAAQKHVDALLSFTRTDK